MRVSAKHEQSVVSFMDFSGGLNFTVGPDAIQDNQFSMAENVEYGALDGSLCKVPGWVPVLRADKPIRMFYPVGFSEVLFVAGQEIYRSDYTTHTKIGETTGAHKPVIVPFGKDLYIATGGKIQRYDSKGNLTTIDSPETAYIFPQENRLVAVHRDDRRMTYSGVLDATKWTDDANDDSSAKWIDVGDNDAGVIVAVGQLYQDLIVFTSTNKAFRLTGTYPNWRQLPYGKDVYATNFHSLATAQNSLFYLGDTGFQAVQPTQAYGDMATVNVGRLINNYLSLNIEPQTCSVWSLPTKWQIWIQPQETGLIYMFHTLNGAFTTRRMRAPVAHVMEYDGAIYMARENTIYEMRDDIATDDGQEVRSELRLKTLRGINRLLLKRVLVDLYSRGTGDAVLSIGKLSMPLLKATDDDIVALDDDIVALDDDAIVGSLYTTLNKRCNYRLERVEPSIVINSGSLSLRRVNLVVAEVG